MFIYFSNVSKRYQQMFKSDDSHFKKTVFSCCEASDQQ